MASPSLGGGFGDSTLKINVLVISIFIFSAEGLYRVNEESIGRLSF